jgi:hypothetical protein
MRAVDSDNHQTGRLCDTLGDQQTHWHVPERGLGVIERERDGHGLSTEPQPSH